MYSVLLASLWFQAMVNTKLQIRWNEGRKGGEMNSTHMYMYLTHTHKPSLWTGMSTFSCFSSELLQLCITTIAINTKMPTPSVANLPRVDLGTHGRGIVVLLYVETSYGLHLHGRYANLVNCAQQAVQR